MKYTITKRKDFPACVQKFKEIKGICVGGCVGSYQFIGLAHSHVHNNEPKIYKDDPHEGWICLRWKHQLKVSEVMLHEMAHILTELKEHNRLFHSKMWKETVVNIGGIIKPFKAYGKKYRGYGKGEY